MNLIKRSVERDAPWYVRFQVNGVRYLRSTDTPLRAAALARAKELLRAAKAQRWEVLEATKQRREVATIGEVLAAYDRGAVGILPKTRLENGQALRRLVRRGLGLEETADVEGRPSAVLTGALVRAVKRAAVAAAAGDAVRIERAKGSVNTLLRCARSVFARGLRSFYADERLELPALEEFMREPPERVARATYQPPADAVIAAITAAAPALRAVDAEAYVAWLLAVGCGLRRSEIARMEWSWVQQVGVDWYVVVPARQKNKRAAAVPMQAKVKAALDEWRLVCGCEPFVLPGGAERQQRCREIFERVGRWLKDLGWTRRGNLHEMRKYFGHLVMEQHGLGAAQTVLRHQDMRTTQQYYTGFASVKGLQVELPL